MWFILCHPCDWSLFPQKGVVFSSFVAAGCLTSGCLNDHACAKLYIKKTDRWKKCRFYVDKIDIPVYSVCLSFYSGYMLSPV